LAGNANHPDITSHNFLEATSARVNTPLSNWDLCSQRDSFPISLTALNPITFVSIAPLLLSFATLTNHVAAARATASIRAKLSATRKMSFT
jgi:hypothetical protein